MKRFVLHSRIRGVALCGALAFALAACGADGTSSTSAASTAASKQSLVNPNVGIIDRSAPAPAPATTALAGAAATGSQPAVTSNPPSTGTVTLDWTPPTENVDGSVLTNLSGYTVYYGTSPSSLTHSVRITNPGLTAYTIANLTPGTWYFAVTSHSTTGAESVRSGTISARI